MRFNEIQYHLWEQYSAARASQIGRWFQLAREMRGSEFTLAKEKDWLDAEITKDTKLRLSLQFNA